MSQSKISPVLKAWYKWKALRLPWRKKFLVGLDLHGNTFWEFRLVNGPGYDGRWRRIVQYPSKTHHGDVNVSPAWHQWLRNTRKDPPSLEEQKADVARQERMKVLAAQADARWAAKESLLGTTDKAPALEGMKGNQGGSREETWKKMQQEQEQGGLKGKNPWKQAAPSGPGEQWQPKAWQPGRK